MRMEQVRDMRKWVSTVGEVLVAVGLVALVVVQAVILPGLSAPTGQPSDASIKYCGLFLVWSIVCVLLVEVALVLVLVLVRARERGQAEQARSGRIAAVVRWDALVAALSIVGFVIADAYFQWSLLVVPVMAAVYVTTAVVCLVSTMMVVRAPGPATRDPGGISDRATEGQPVSTVERVLAVVVLVVVVAVQVYELPRPLRAHKELPATPGRYYPFFPVWFIVCLLLVEVALVLVLLRGPVMRAGAGRALAQWDLLAGTCMAAGLWCTANYDLAALVTVPVGVLVVAICLAATAVTTSVCLAPPRGPDSVRPR